MNTADLPATPVRDGVILASQWEQRPDVLPPDALYRRRIGPWLLWRTGPPKGDDTHYYAFHADDLARSREFPADGQSFRTWKEGLRDSP